MGAVPVRPAKYMKVTRKELLTKVADRLFGGVLPFVACENNDALVSWAGLSDGATKVSIDDWPNLRLRMASIPKSAKMLRDDWVWKDVGLTGTGTNGDRPQWWGCSGGDTPSKARHGLLAERI